MLSINELVERATKNATLHGWSVTKENLPIYLMLTVSELAHAAEAWRDKDWDKVSHELADAVIRIAHITGDLELDLNTTIELTMKENESRPYHHGHEVI